MADVTIPWDEIPKERCEMIRSGGTRYNQALDVGSNVEFWRQTGESLDVIQAEAMRLAKVNQPTGKGYNLYWRGLADAAGGEPAFRKMNKATRSASLWLHNNWSVVGPWWSDLAPNIRAKCLHPTSIRLKFEAKDKERKPKPVEEPVTLAQLLVMTDDETLVHQLCKTKWSNPERRQELIALIAESIDRDRKLAEQVEQLAADVAEVRAKCQKAAAARAPAPKRRGRPPGVRNKPKMANGARAQA